MTDLQKQTIRAIVDIFETGRMGGDYSAVRFVPGEAGHLSYGYSRASLESGTLIELLDSYCRRPDSRFAGALGPWMVRVVRRDLTLECDEAFRAVLSQAGNDPAMRALQDDLFERAYFLPARTSALAMGIVSPLGQAVVYDSCIQGVWRRLKAQLPPLVSVGGEARWLPRYLELQRSRPQSKDEPSAPPAYRMDTFARLIGANNWGLALPIEVRGITIPAKLCLPRAA